MSPEDTENQENEGIKGAFDAGAPVEAKPAGVLFEPEECDLYVNKVTLAAYIFHGKPVEPDIEKLIYDPEDHSVTVVKKDGQLLDLGVKIQWLVRPYFTKANEVSIVQTKDGESVAGFIVPFVHKGQE